MNAPDGDDDEDDVDSWDGYALRRAYHDMMTNRQRGSTA